MQHAVKHRPLRETELLEQALNVFYETTGHQFKIEAIEQDDHGCRADALIRLLVPGAHHQFVVEIKNPLTNATLAVAIEQLKQFPQQGIVVTEYVNPNMAERMKDMGVQYIDLAGNAYIDAPPLLIYIKGNKPKGPLEKQTATRAFQPTGLKVLFALFCNPALVNAPYRDIAKAANVALGTVGWVFTDLRELGYLAEKGKRHRRLRNKKELFNRWVTAYPEQLRPKLIIGRYTTDETVWWKDAKLQKLNGYMGGEAAAEYLTHYLKPEFITVYVREQPAELQLTFKLKKDPQGNVELLKTFWDVACDWTDNKIVNPILVYADLVATGDPRNMETAQIIYEKEIDRYLRED